MNGGTKIKINVCVSNILYLVIAGAAVMFATGGDRLPLSFNARYVAGIVLSLLMMAVSYIPRIIGMFTGYDWFSDGRLSKMDGRNLMTLFFVFRILTAFDLYSTATMMTMWMVMMGMFVLIEICSWEGGILLYLLNGIDKWEAAEAGKKLLSLQKMRDEAFPAKRSALYLAIYLTFLLGVLPMIASIYYGDPALASGILAFMLVLHFNWSMWKSSLRKLCAEAETLGGMIEQGQTAELRQLKEKLERGLFRVKCFFALIPVIIAGVVAAAVL
jgi:hypothetical protein